jgi:hypothetical protein
MSKQKKASEDRATMAIYNFCRTTLFLAGMITEKQNVSIYKKLSAFRFNKKIEITYEQMCAVNLKYTGK